MYACSKIPKFVVGLLAVGLLVATPLAAAFGMGVDAASVVEMKNAGATPQYAQIWVGSWVLKSGWSSIDASLQKAEDVGATPVIQYYYWGDSISVNGVKYGQEGRTKAQWFALAKSTATHAKDVMGDKPFLMVLEPEFNKNGIQYWEEFDGLLAQMARDIKAIAPNAKIVTGLGYWNTASIFDRTVAESSYVGFMLLRASTRDSSTEGIGAADQIISTAKTLKAKWNKPVVVFDFGIATYGGWEWVQEAALQKVINKRADIDAAGVEAIVWRYVHDNSYSSGYFGAAESTWGVKYAGTYGGAKRGYGELATLIKGSAGSTSSTMTTTPTTTLTASATTSTAATTGSTSTSAFTATFSDVKVLDWWVEVTVRGSEGIGKVEASVGGGPYVQLTKQSWGDYAKSIRVLGGQSVTFRATSTSGATFASDGASGIASAPAPTSATTTAAGLDATFKPRNGNEWWIQVEVDSPKALRTVETRVNGGAWQLLKLQSWGDHAASYRAPSGSKVEFRATATDGTSDISAAYTWPAG